MNTKAPIETLTLTFDEFIDFIEGTALSTALCEVNYLHTCKPLHNKDLICIEDSNGYPVKISRQDNETVVYQCRDGSFRLKHGTNHYQIKFLQVVRIKLD